MGIKLGSFVKSSNWLNGESLKAILDDLEDDSVMGKILSIDEIEGDSFDKKKKEMKVKLTLLVNGEEKDMTLNNTQLKVLVSWLDGKGYEDDSDKLIGVNLNLSLTQAQNGKPSIVIAVSRKQSNSLKSPTISHNAPNLGKERFEQTNMLNGLNRENLANLGKVDNSDYQDTLGEIGHLIEAISNHTSSHVQNNSCTFAIDSDSNEKTVKLLAYDVYSKANGAKLESYKRDLEFCLDCLNKGFIAW